MDSLGFESSGARGLVVVAIGAGSTMICHSNDSYFWVVTQVSGLNVSAGYGLMTIGSILQGLTAGLVVWVLGLFLL